MPNIIWDWCICLEGNCVVHAFHLLQHSLLDPFISGIYIYLFTNVLRPHILIFYNNVARATMGPLNPSVVIVRITYSSSPMPPPLQNLIESCFPLTLALSGRLQHQLERHK